MITESIWYFIVGNMTGALLFKFGQVLAYIHTEDKPNTPRK